VPDLPAERQHQIIEWLQSERTISIDVLVERLGVSPMTVHRDLDRLESDGLVEKLHGGVRLARKAAADTLAGCAVCGKPVPERTTFVVETPGGERLQACCPHCGFLLLGRQAEVTSVLAVDFIHGHMVNALQATFLIEPDLRLCCVPTVLCFASRGDAERFRAGFGGELLGFDEAYRHLSGLHQL